MGIIQGLGERIAKPVSPLRLMSLRTQTLAVPLNINSSLKEQLKTQISQCGPGASVDSRLASVQSAKLAGASVRHVLPITAEPTGEG